MEEYLYAVGDKVKILSNPPGHSFEERFHMKSGPWCKDPVGPSMNNSMREMAGKVVTITACVSGYYEIEEDHGAHFWTDTMFEGKANSVNFRSLL